MNDKQNETEIVFVGREEIAYWNMTLMANPDVQPGFKLIDGILTLDFYEVNPKVIDLSKRKQVRKKPRKKVVKKKVMKRRGHK